MTVCGLFTSCSWFSEGPDDQVIDISEEFAIRAVERYTQDGRSLAIHLETIQPICQSSTLNLQTSQSGEHVDVLIQKIDKPDTCLTAETILSTSADFGLIEHPTYYLNVSLRNIIDNAGTIEVFNDRIVTSIEDPKGIIIQPQETFRLPESTIWGYARSKEVDYNGRIIDFVTDLSLMSQSIVLQTGQYSDFHIDNSGVLHFDDFNSSVGDATFFYKFTGSDQELEDLLAAYRQDAGQKAEFKVFSTNGKTY
jgi:hypothetical protein